MVCPRQPVALCEYEQACRHPFAGRIEGPPIFGIHGRYATAYLLEEWIVRVVWFAWPRRMALRLLPIGRIGVNVEAGVITLGKPWCRGCPSRLMDRYVRRAILGGCGARRLELRTFRRRSSSKNLRRHFFGRARLFRFGQLSGPPCRLLAACGAIVDRRRFHAVAGKVVARKVAPLPHLYAVDVVPERLVANPDMLPCRLRHQSFF